MKQPETNPKKMTRKQRHDIAIKNFENIITPEVLEEAERLQKQMSRISPEELYREFTT